MDTQKTTALDNYRRQLTGVFMLLTNKEVLELHEKTGDIFELAEAIERAVLAKAGEQNIVGFSIDQLKRLSRDLHACEYDSDVEQIADELDLQISFMSEQLPSQAIPEGWREDWKKHVMQLWMCARRNDASIPDDQLDFMRDMLLSASPKP